jgi:hypothetical protein
VYRIPDVYPESRIPDTTTGTKEEGENCFIHGTCNYRVVVIGFCNPKKVQKKCFQASAVEIKKEKKICCPTFFDRHKYHKIENYSIFELEKKKIEPDYNEL